MNISGLHAFLGTAQRPISQPNHPVDSRLDVTFKELLIGGISVEEMDEPAPPLSYAELTKEILNAETVGEIVETLSTNEAFSEPTELLEMNSESLLEKIAQSQLLEEEIVTRYGNDLSSLLNFIDDFAPEFFASFLDLLERKKELPKEQAVEIVAILKAVSIVAPQQDLGLAKEQQVFSLKSYLNAATGQLEKIMQENAKQSGMPRFMEIQTNKNALSNQSGQHEAGKKNSKEILEHMAQSIVRPSVPKGETSQTNYDDVNKKNIKANPKETMLFSIHQSQGLKSGLPLNELENRTNARTETLLREMQNIFQRSNFGQTGGTNRLLIKLYPEHLGQIRIELLQTNGVMTARILASTALGKDMLESHLNQLRHAFLQQNVQVDRIEITQTLQDTPRNDRDQQSSQQQFGKKHEQPEEQHEQNAEEEMTFEQFMIELGA